MTPLRWPVRPGSFLIRWNVPDYFAKPDHAVTRFGAI